MSTHARSPHSPYILSFSKDCLEGRLSPFNGVEIETMSRPADTHSFVHHIDEMNHYVSLIQRPYEKLNRSIAQIAGLLILCQADNGFITYAELASTPTQRVLEALDLLSGLQPPTTAKAHFKHLLLAANTLLEVATALHGHIVDASALKTNTPAWLERLNAVNSMLHCASSPQLGLSPVDFQQGCYCCSNP